MSEFLPWILIGLLIYASFYLAGRYAIKKEIYKKPMRRSSYLFFTVLISSLWQLSGILIVAFVDVYGASDLGIFSYIAILFLIPLIAGYFIGCVSSGRSIDSYGNDANAHYGLIPFVSFWLTIRNPKHERLITMHAIYIIIISLFVWFWSNQLYDHFEAIVEKNDSISSIEKN